MKKKTQIFMIHGGMTFKNRKDYFKWLKSRVVSIEKSKRWTDDLENKLSKNFDVIRPRMPLSENSMYEDWKIFFELHIPFIKNNVIFIGNSLGSIFLAKYLSEHKFPKKILATYLVCPPFDDTCFDEDLVNGFELKKDLSLLEKNSKNLTLMFSEDDDDVPIDHARKYGEKLKNAKIIIYKSKNGHFNVSTFPEIIKMIKEDVKKLK